jgi:ParB family chromosome partitioning protein
MSGERQNRGLGMGLSALLGEAKSAPVSGEADRGVREVDIARIRRNPNQPRKYFDEAALDELSKSIAARGVLQPILVRPLEDGGFEIVAGERRWRAAQLAQLHAIPAIVRDIDDASTAEIALIENVQRQDLNAIEEAEGYRQLIEHFGHTQDDIGRIVHKSRSHVANLLRLLDLPEFVRQSLVNGDISMGHARAVASSSDPEALTREIIAQGLSVREAERLAQKARPGAVSTPARASVPKAASASNADLEALQRQLADLLGLRVKVHHHGNSGSILLHYSTLDQLDMICQRLSGEPI